jgi:hypothetical protein
VSQKVRRTKPYVCVDCDYAEHFRFQGTKDLEVAAGTWLRCLTHSRAQEQDGIVTLSWLRRTFAGKKFKRVDELVRVGLLRNRDDGDYEIHAYAPRNQTKAMLAEERGNARERMRAVRALRAQNASDEEGDVPPNKRVTHALVPTSTSTSISISSSSSDVSNVMEIPSSPKGEAGEGVGGEAGGGTTVDARASSSGSSRRRPLPPSERLQSGNFWIAAFAEGISEVKGSPYTAGREFLTVLERIVTHHAPLRDAPSACTWLREQAQAFARQWEGVHPPKGLTPDGLERWLNEGRLGPPTFGKKRIQQLPPEEYLQEQPDDLQSKYGAEVVE